MLNTLLIDNDLAAIKILEVMLQENCPQINICGKANTFNEAVDQINLHVRPDVIFSEIDLPLTSGFKFAESKLVDDCELIFVTTNPTYALKAIKKQAAGFLLKPVKKKELLHVVDIAEDRIKEKKDVESNKLLIQKYESEEIAKNVVGIPTIEGFEILHLSEIVRCEGMQNCTRIITKDRSDIISSYNLGKFTRLLGKIDFLSPHKSHLVNIHYIKKYLREGTIIMYDDSYVPVSKRRKMDVLKHFRLL
jgi:two-component system LytT family response regulator